MSKKLFVGCRVRILYSLGWPELAGQTGRIVGDGSNLSIDAISRGCEWNVAPDCWGTNQAPYPSVNGRGLFSPGGDQLEPIVPDGGASKYTYHELMDKLRAGEVAAV